MDFDVQRLADKARLRARSAPDRASADRYQGIADGLTSQTRTLLRTEWSVWYHAGFLTGQLQAWMFSRVHVDTDLLIQCGAYGASLATDEGQRCLGSLSAAALLKAHTYAFILAARKSPQMLPSAETERLMYEWLCQQANVALTDDIASRYERMRQRRLGRLLAKA